MIWPRIQPIGAITAYGTLLSCKRICELGPQLGLHLPIALRGSSFKTKTRFGAEFGQPVGGRNHWLRWVLWSQAPESGLRSRLRRNR